jgi:hypothetical protein
MFVTTTGYLMGINIYTDGPIETRGSTTTHTVLPECLDGALFDGFVARKTSKIVAGEIEHLLAGIGEFWPWSIRSRNNGD